MRVSLSPSVPPRSWVPTRAGGTLLFYSSAPRRGTALHFRVRTEVCAAFDSIGSWKRAAKKKPAVMQPLSSSSAKRQCSAAGRWFALSLTAGAPPQIRARGRCFALDFSLRARAVSWLHTDLDSSPTRSVWRIHVPRIWIRSINGRKFSVKGKTQNVGDVFVLRLFVVVLILLNRFLFNTFRPLASHATLLVVVSA